MELSDYELVRYPSGQLVITRVALTDSGAPSSGPRDVIGAYTSEQEAQSALLRLAGASVSADRQAADTSSSTAQSG